MPIFQNPVDQSPEEYVAGRFIQEGASRSAGAYVAEAVSGQNPDTYDEGWADVADQFREQFPNIEPERAQRMYEQARHQSAIEGLTSTPRGGQESSVRTWTGRVPVVGGLYQSSINERDTAALERIRDGGATLDDYAQYREMAGHQTAVSGRSNWRNAGETILGSAAFGADMAIANLALPGLGTAAAGGSLAARTTGAAIRGIGIANAMPGRLMASVSEHMMPDVARDANGQLHIGGDKTWGDAFQGYLDHQIEIWSEMSGEALLHGAGAVINRLPGAARAQAVASGLAARISTNPGLRTALNQFGWSNMLGEFLEERAGELARGVTGVSNDYGMTGNVLAGRYTQALNQLAVEGLAFGGMQVGITGASAAMNRRSPGQVAMQSLQRQGVPESAAREQVMAAAESIANGTATPAEVRPGPLRDLAQAVHERVQEAEKVPSPAQTAVEEAQSGTAPLPIAEQQASLAANAAPTATTASLVPEQPSGSKTEPSEWARNHLTTQTFVASARLADGSVTKVSPAGAIGGEYLVPGGNLIASNVVNEWLDSKGNVLWTRPTGQKLTTSQAPQAAPVATQAPAPTQTAPEALAGQPGASSAMSAVVAPSAAHVTKAPPQALAGLWLRHFAGEAGIREQINAQAKLSPKEAAILWSRLPVEQGGDGKTLAQVGQEQGGVSRQRIEQVEKKARAKAAFDVSVNEFKQQAAGLQREGASVTTAKEAGLRATSKEGFQARETPTRPEDIISDRMLAILQEADATGKPLTEAQKQSVYSTCADLMQQVENDARRNKSKGFTAKRIEAAFRKGIEAAEDRASGAQAGSADTAASSQTERRAQGTQRVQAQSEVRLARGAASGTAEREFRPVTADELDAVAKLSPHHAALVGKVRGFALSANLPIQKKVEYLRNQVTILNGMPAQAAAIYNANLKKINYHIDADTLTRTVARESDVVRDAMSTGYIVPGVYHRGTGVMNLDGESEFGTGARVAGHEAAHAMDGPQESISNAADVKEAYVKEALKGVNGEYSRESPHEFLAEFLGLIHSGEMTAADAQAKMPLMYQAMLSRGLIEAAHGKGAMTEAPADIFDRAINDGPLHADATRLARISKDDVKAGAKVAMTWAGKLKERVLDYIHNNIRPAIRLEAAARKAGYSPGVGMNYANVMERLQFGDKRYAEDMRMNGMATLQDGHWTRTGLPWEQVIAPLTDEDKAPVDGRKSAWQKTKDWFNNAETEPVSKFDLFATARHIVDEAARGQFVVPEEEVANFQAVLDEFAADPEFVQRATAVHDALTREVYNASLDSRASPDVHNLTREEAERFKKAHPTYIETTRIMEDDAFFPQPVAGVQKSRDLGHVMAREGNSSRSIVPPLVTAYNRYQKTASLVLEQIRRNQLAEILRLGLPGWAENGDTKVKFEIEKDGLKAAQVMRQLNMSQAEVDKFLEQFEALGATAQAYFIQKPWSDKTANLFWWKDQNGNLTNFKILDRSLYELATGQQGNGNAVIEMLRAASNIGFNTPAGRFKVLPAMTQLVKTGATTASAAFQINNTLNPMRDPLTFLTNTIDQTTAKDLPAMIVRVYQAEVNALRGKTDDVLFQYFRQAGGEATKMFPAADIPNMGSSKIEYIKQLIRTGQAGELAPRFLEFRTRLKQLGWSEERIIEEAAKAHEQGGNYRDPVPFGVRLEAEHAAAEVTGPFQRGGILTREINQVVPFFQPSVAVLGKQISNWRTNAKGAAIAMGIYLGFKLAHFLRYKDEDWYKELNGYDRFNNFVVMTPMGLRRIQGARGFEVPIGGTLTSLLERMYGQRPDLIGLLEQTHSAIAPPAPIPSPVSLAWELRGNQDWLGRPIVPGRDERLSGWDKAKQYQIPYATRALTGGRAEVSLRGAGLTVAAQVRPHRSVDELFSQFGHLETARAQAQRQGVPFQFEADYRRLSHATNAIRELSRTLRGEALVNGHVVKRSEPGQEEQDVIRLRQADVARQAMGWAR